MKNQAQNQVLGVFILITMFTLVACQEEESPLIPSNPETIEDTLITQDWKISLFIDSGNEETYHFNGFTFDFQEDGILVANNGSETKLGVWSLMPDNSPDDDQSQFDLNILFGGNDEFQELDDDWDIISQSDTKVELIDISGGNGGTDYLTFEKI